MMGHEINLLRNYPKTKRALQKRALEKTAEDIRLAQEFGAAFFDGERKHGYGGFSYHPRFWQPVIPDFINHFGITSESSILDVGCAKGFMLHDFQQILPGIKVVGIDVSEYAIENCIPSQKENLIVGNAKSLPFEDNSFDFILSVNTIHNLELEECKKALREIERVSRRGAFIMVDAYENENEKEDLLNWVLTAKTILSVDKWKEVFQETGYSGDFFWFRP